MSGGHVYVTLFGFGKRIVPASSPFEMRLEASGSLVVALGGDRITVSMADASTESISSNSVVADVIVGPTESAWWIDAGAFRLPLPIGWTLLADGGTAPPFFLVDPHGAAVFVQIADEVPTGDDLVGIGQSVIDRSPIGPSESVELAYELDGRAWRQRHTVLTLQSKPYAVLTAQAPLEAFAAARALAVCVAGSIVFSGR